MPVALVTGITGQDGGYLAEQLVSEGTVVHGLTRAGEAVPPHLVDLGAAVVLHEADLLDQPRMAAVLAAIAPDEVYNLAGLSSVAQSWQEPVLTHQVNGVAVGILLDGLWQHQEETGRRVRVVQASSAEIFAGSGVVPQDEGTPIAPLSPYGAAKAFAHHLVGVYREQGLHAVNAVLYNHESPRRPETFVTRKITRAAAAIAAGQQEHLELGNLEARRDWGWAPEYVDALVRAVRADAPADFVIASGQSHRVSDFVAAAFAHAGLGDWQPYVRSDPGLTRPTDSVDLVGDARRARELLGWVPQVGFPELVARMVDHDRELLARTPPG
ncbi:MAG TPA: GDP-mannose 4,6-dehydratase [Mycobacteriales bacterium]|nr:GDP-mannose 4,6-dehydratase [Mycobacteriales bacterium]